MFVNVPAAGVEPERAGEPWFNGRDLAGWSGPSGQPGPAWEVVDGLLHLDKKKGRGGILLSDRAIDGDFELSFEWRVAEGGNSGIKYRVRQYGNQWLGCEYQLLDDARHGNGRNPLTSAGALYGLVAPDPGKRLRPIGEFNTSRVVVRGQTLEHWLNDDKILSIEVGGADWRRRIERSKFNDKPGFGIEPAGRLLIQDHGNEVWFRSIEVRVPRDAGAE